MNYKESDIDKSFGCNCILMQLSQLIQNHSNHSDDIILYCITFIIVLYYILSCNCCTSIQVVIAKKGKKSVH